MIMLFGILNNVELFGEQLEQGLLAFCSDFLCKGLEGIVVDLMLSENEGKTVL